MSRRLRRIEKLFRLRSLERDVASADLVRAVLAEQQAQTDFARGTAQVTRIEKDFRDLLSASPMAAFVRATENSRGRARELAAAAGGAVDQARKLTAQQRAQTVAAQQRVRSVEILMERAKLEARSERLRSEQKRIDDSASARRGQWKRIPMVAAVVALSIVSAPVATSQAAEGGEVPSKAQATATAGSLEASFSAIRVRQADLDRRERELDDREKNLGELERSVLTRLAELEQLSELVQSRIATWKEAEGGKSISRLSRIYGVMPPDRAARLVGGLDLELATQIVSKMKPKQSSALLALLEKDQARKMSERIAHPLSMEPAKAPEDPR